MNIYCGMRRPLRLSLLCVILVAVLMPSAASPADATGAQATRVDIVVLPLEATAQAFYAKHRGFFLKHGIDARIKVLADPTQLAAVVLSDEAQFSSVSVGALAILKTRGAPVRVVAAGSLWQPKAPTAALLAAPGRVIRRPRDLVGKHVAVDIRNNLGHVALLKWLKNNGMSADDIRLTEIPFPQMLGPLERGVFDAGLLPEPFMTIAVQRGLKPIANILNAVCPQGCLSTMWMARKDVDLGVAARFRNSIQAASVWANQERNHAASGAILARYAPIDRAIIRRMTRVTFATRLRPAMAQPWIDAFAEFGVIPESFRAIDLVK
jgi:NitT/TauT family transport system substrate-binding protein